MSKLQRLIDCKVKLELMPYQIEIFKSLVKSELMNIEYMLRGKEPNLTKEERSNMIIEYHRIYNMLEDATKE
ncbi:MAG: hypothetical protein [Arizlama microvirus]|nr:MAG: hypothetical protein [Arizlama microvirus]